MKKLIGILLSISLFSFSVKAEDFSNLNKYFDEWGNAKYLYEGKTEELLMESFVKLNNNDQKVEDSLTNVLYNLLSKSEQSECDRRNALFCKKCNQLNLHKNLFPFTKDNILNAYKIIKRHDSLPRLFKPGYLLYRNHPWFLYGGIVITAGLIIYGIVRKIKKDKEKKQEEKEFLEEMGENEKDNKNLFEN